MTKTFIEENLLNKSGKLIHQKLHLTTLTKEELYLILHETEPLKCTKCNENHRFVSFTSGYYPKCSNRKCNLKKRDISEFTKEQIKKQINEKGINSTFTVGISNSVQEIYNHYYSLKNPICPKCKEPFGFDSFSKGYSTKCRTKDCIVQQRKETTLKNHGDENFNNRPKMFKTKLKNHGDQNFVNSKKAKETKLKNHGNSNFVNIEKRLETIKEMKKCFISRNKKYPKYNLDKLTKEYIEQNFIEEGILQKDEFMKFYNCKDNWMNVNLRNLGVELKRDKVEERINALFDNQFILRDKNLIKPLEIDLLNEEHKFGIEYNGLMWHSEGESKYPMFNNKNLRKNHLNKTNLMEDKGYSLFHIFENEFLDQNKKEIWISVINDRLNLNTKIGARKCSVKEVPTQEARDFINENHLQGYNNASVKIGLYYSGQLYSIMTFGKSRFNKKYDYELIRFCTKKGYTVQGGGSKLLSYFERTFAPKSLISYANRRWSQGNFYVKAGFDFIENTPPNYFYFKENSLELKSRNQFQKHKLKGILKDFYPELTETQNMFNNNYRKIYDSGNKVFIKSYK